MPYTLSIPTTTVSGEAKPYTVYNLSLSTPLRTLTIQKRYSDFTRLHSELSTAAGVPPGALPAKSWFTRTVNNPELTETRRQGLQAYLKAIEDSPDPKWRNSAPYKTFLGFTVQDSTRRGKSALEEEALAPERPPSMSSQQWLDLHADLKSHMHNARMALTKRDSAATATQQHEASAQAKKCLVKSQTLILRLDTGLGQLQAGKGGEKLGEGEIRRRKDLLGRARKEREGLEGVLNSFVSHSGRTNGVAGRSAPLRRDSDDASIRSNNSMPGAFPSGPSVGGRRVLGGPPPKETERTRQLDNQQVLQLQQEIMQAQDSDVKDLSSVVRKMREMGLAINEELVEQQTLLEMLDQDVDRVDGKIRVAKNRIGKIK
jgi:regulator of vacuolar morphogenesis